MKFYSSYEFSVEESLNCTAIAEDKGNLVDCLGLHLFTLYSGESDFQRMGLF